MPKVFLGGTCNGSQWRGKLKSELKIDYFDPVVPNWTEEAYKEEILQRDVCDVCLYVITPTMTGTYSIAEVVDDSNKRPEKTVFCFMETEILESKDGILKKNEFDKSQIKSLEKVGIMIEKNGGTWVKSFDELPSYLNSLQ